MRGAATAPAEGNKVLVQSATLSAVSGVRHAFFTRVGGVSEGVYASLNGGTGSKDIPERVAANREHMAAALGCSPQRFLTAYDVHSPIVVIADRPWTQADHPRADAIVT